ncbi:MAG: nitrous oxide-stimulated promoter family protein [bacterium]
MLYKHPRLKRERKTLKITIEMYCKGNHKVQSGICPACSELMEYSLLRLDKCPYQEGKTTCANCPTHCYKKDMREKIRDVMRYAGPRMTSKHPILAFFHFIDGMKKKPSLAGGS